MSRSHPPPRSTALLSNGKIAAGTRTQFARVGIGVFVRINAARPDLTSVDGFKRALLDAQAVGYGDPAKGGVSGTAMAALVEQTGHHCRPEGKNASLSGQPGGAYGGGCG